MSVMRRALAVAAIGCMLTVSREAVAQGTDFAGPRYAPVALRKSELPPLDKGNNELRELCLERVIGSTVMGAGVGVVLPYVLFPVLPLLMLRDKREFRQMTRVSAIAGGSIGFLVGASSKICRS
jgi:hypothetical protein